MLVVLPAAPLFLTTIHRFVTDLSLRRREFSVLLMELIAIEYSLKAFGPILRNSRVKWFTDSQSSVRIVEMGSMQFSLHTLAISTLNFVFGIT